MPLSIQTLGIYCCPNKNANWTINKGPVQKIPVFLSIPFCGLCCWASLSWPSVAAGMLKYHVKSCGSACDDSNMSWSTKHQKSHRTDALMNFQPSLAQERIQIDLGQTSDFLFVLFFFFMKQSSGNKTTLPFKIFPWLHPEDHEKIFQCNWIFCSRNTPGWTEHWLSISFNHPITSHFLEN